MRPACIFSEYGERMTPGALLYRFRARDSSGSGRATP